MTEQQVLEKNYKRLQDAIEDATGLLIPAFDNKKAKKVLKFLVDYANENIATGKLITTLNVPAATTFKVPNVEKVVPVIPVKMDNTLLVELKRITHNFENKSVHSIHDELKNLRKLVLGENNSVH